MVAELGYARRSVRRTARWLSGIGRRVSARTMSCAVIPELGDVGSRDSDGSGTAVTVVGWLAFSMDARPGKDANSSGVPSISIVFSFMLVSLLLYPC
jgi:hypothetical protein